MRGISPIIAMVILITMAIALAGSLYYWLSRQSVKIREAIGEEQEERMKRDLAKAELLDVNCSFPKLIIAIKNGGQVDFNGTMTISLISGYTIAWINQTQIYIPINEVRIYEFRANVENKSYMIKIDLPYDVTLYGQC